MIYHRLELMKSSRGECGVAIILSLLMIKAYQANNEEPSLTSSSKDEVDSRRFISINIKLNLKLRAKKGALKKKKVKKFMALVTLASIYYPVCTDDHETMIECIENKVED